MAQYEQFFRAADTDNSGFLTLAELTAVLQKNGYKADQAKAYFDSIDREQSDKVSLDEFLSAMGQRPAKDHKSAGMRRVFRSFDKNGDGSIDRSELKAIFDSLGDHLSDAEVARFLAHIDKDSSGTLSYEEFISEFYGS